MRKVVRASLLAAFAASLLSGSSPAPRWWKGNTHTHTLWSDGDAAPEAVGDWYKSHGYHFLVLSDHNILAEGEKWVKVGPEKGTKLEPKHVEDLIARYGAASVKLREQGGKREMRLKTLDELKRLHEEPDRFLYIKGEEITDKFEKLPIHHNSINHVHLIKPPGGASVREVMQKTIAAVKAEAARTGKPVMVHLNHPNFGWGITPDDLAYVVDERFFEVYNGHRGVRNYGDEKHAGTEKMWDHALTLRLGKLGGEPLFGLATDDAHNYHKAQATANPGRGWIMVRATELAADAITRAIVAGDFYGTSGVTLEDVESDAKGLRLRIAAAPGVSYVTRFIGTRVVGDRPGEAGVVLQESNGPEAAYRFAGDELYVRAAVVSTRRHANGYSPDDFESAWIQPVVLRRLGK